MSAISIIVPVYNVENYLRRCLDSILAQTFSDWECILVDDGSPDASGMICNEYAEKDSRFKVIHKENGGQAIARNMALDIVSGEFISFVDSDDCIHPAYLETLYTNAIKYNADISVCSYADFTDTIPNGIIEHTKPIQNDAKVFLRNCLLNSVPKKPWILCDKLWHRSLIDVLKMPVGRVHEDNAVVYKAIYSAKTVADCNDKLYYYFQNPTGTMKKPNPKRSDDYLLMLSEMIIFFRQHNETDLENKISKTYLNALAEAYTGAVKNTPNDKNRTNRLKDKIEKTVASESKKYPITIETHPQIFEILHPTYSKLYWTKKGLSHKLKGK